MDVFKIACFQEVFRVSMDFSKEGGGGEEEEV
jgi:hypothetical protein